MNANNQAFTEMVDRLKRGDIPSTKEFAQSVAEIQQEMRVTRPAPDITLRRVTGAEARIFLIAVLKHLEQTDLPKMIADAELLRRQLGMPSMLFKRLGDCL